VKGLGTEVGEEDLRALFEEGVRSVRMPKDDTGRSKVGGGTVGVGLG